jgi:hypothetical protein
MEGTATGTLFANNLEIDENVEAKADLDPTTFILNIIEKCLHQPNIPKSSSPTTFVFNITKKIVFNNHIFL